MEQAKPVSSSGPPSSVLPLPPSRPQLHSLPDIAHDGIGSFLTAVEVNDLMVVARWLMETYGQQAMEVVVKKGLPVEFNVEHRRVIYVDPQGLTYDGELPLITYKVDQEKKQRQLWPETTSSNVCLHPDVLGRLLQRRPRVTTVVIQDEAAAMALAKAAYERDPSVGKIECLRVRNYNPNTPGFGILFRDVKRGALPSLTTLDLDAHGNLNISPAYHTDYLSTMSSWSLLGAGSRKSKEGGYQGLTKLTLHIQPRFVFFGGILWLSLFLPFMAHKTLEELILKGFQLDEGSQDEVVKWLSNSGGARHLRVLVAPCQSASALAIALSSPGMAPRLQVLDIGCVDQASVQALTVAMERNAWPYLRELNLIHDGSGTPEILFRLLNALDLCSPNLSVLRVKGQQKSGNKETAMVVTESLLAGAFPSLQELSLRGTRMGCTWVVDLARALEMRPHILRKVDLYDCLVDEEGMKELAKAFHGRDGAGAHLQSLDLNNNQLGWLGAVYLADAMRSGGLGQLQELYVKQAGLGEAGMTVIVEALKSNACPRLTHHAIMTQVLPDAGPDFSATLREEMVESLRGSRRMVV